MTRLKTRLITTLLTMAVVPFVHANDQQEAALSLMALNSGSANLVNLAPKVQHISKGVVTELELDTQKNNSMAYEFNVVDMPNDKQHKIRYSVSQGDLLKHTSESLTTLGFSELDKEDQHAVLQVTQANFDLLSTLIKLESKYSAKVLEAELDSKKGIVFYEVELANSTQGLQKLLINVANGEEIPVVNRKH
ncbi:PepSY domain-containing protein [Vibrio rarus]|uniref:PepSY domain-containing protein n=1 Tax=Vibrio rarus TaxID=413403 RepID=UPI0021C3A88C|nr:hypothetical protein [Vibrio rarus]